VQSELRIAGIPVGRELPPGIPRKADTGSIIVVVATDAPLLPNQLKRLARRVPLGLGRMGSYSGDGSGDIFVAFSTANSGAWGAAKDANGQPNVKAVQVLPNDDLNPIFLATVQSVEEAVVNTLIAAKTMKGINDFEVDALPHAELQQVLKKYNRLVEPQK
jgi:L-aminopeptidase/D-esterase-like protein